MRNALGRTGGNIPSHPELLDFVRKKAVEIGVNQGYRKEQMAYV